MTKGMSTEPKRFDAGDIKPADLPAPPQAALALIKACSIPDISNQELAKLASSDLILSAELLRVVNTPLFGFSGQIQSVAKAITLLGIRALRSLVLCLAVRDALRPDELIDFDVVSYWENALRRATAAHLLASAAGLDADECFTAGLLQDFGLLVLFHLNPETAIRWSEFALLDPDARYAAELSTFNVQHDTVVAMLAKAWGLPDELTTAVGNHHTAFPAENNNGSATNSADASPLCRVLHCADWAAALFGANDATFVLEQTHDKLAREFALGTEAIDALLAGIPQEVESAATALGLNVSQQNDFEQIMSEANLRLAEENFSYQELTWRLGETLRERDRLAEALERELALAREIQQGLMPKASGSDFPIHGINLSAHQLSGDFYDFFALPDGRLYFILGDVSGKGVNAALLMSKASSLFRCLGKDIHEPGRLLARINQELCETATRGMFVTAIAGLYDPSQQSICLVNAGHPPALLFGSDGRGKAFSAETTPLGIFPDQVFEGVEFSLGGGCLYLYSDGVTEGCLADGTEMGMEGLVRCLKVVNKLPVAERLGVVTAQFQHEASSLRDDITLLVIEAQITKPETLLKASFPAHSSQLQAIRQRLHDTFAAQDCAKALADQWVLAINEACMNVIQHAYCSNGGSDHDSEMIIEVLRCGDEWTFRLTDFAEPVDKTKVCPRDLDDIRPGGLGVHFIREIMDEVAFLDSVDGLTIDSDDTQTIDCKTRGNILQMKSHSPAKEEPDT